MVTGGRKQDAYVIVRNYHQLAGRMPYECAQVTYLLSGEFNNASKCTPCCNEVAGLLIAGAVDGL